MIGMVGSALAGCQSSESFAKLEQELRGQEAQVRDLQSQLVKSEQQLQDQDQQLAAHRMPTNELSSETHFAMVSQSAGVSADNAAQIPEEVLAAWGSVSELRIQKLVSGIQWNSGKPVLHVVIRPVDADGELCKVAGQLSVQARRVSRDAEPNLLVEESWTITQSRDLWTKAFVSAGFHVQLPIPNEQAAQDARRILVTATLQLGQGREFEVTETINLPVSAKSSVR